LTWLSLVLFLAWALLVPAVGLMISIQCNRLALALTHAMTLVVAVALGAAAVYTLDR